MYKGYISYTHIYMYAQSLSHVQLSATPWTIASQAPLSIGFSRQEYWSGLPFPSPGDLPELGIELRSPALQAERSTKLLIHIYKLIFIRHYGSGTVLGYQCITQDKPAWKVSYFVQCPTAQICKNKLISKKGKKSKYHHKNTLYIAKDNFQ